jgi:hypothetical protein
MLSIFRYSTSRGDSDSNKNVDVKFSADDAFLE